MAVEVGVELDFILDKAAREDYIEHVKVEKELDFAFFCILRTSRVWSRRKELLIFLFKAFEQLWRSDNWL